MLNKTIDQDKAIQLVAHPFGEQFGAAIVVLDRSGGGTWKHITPEDALTLAKDLEAYALGE